MDELIVRHAKALRTKVTAKHQQRYAELIAAEIYEQLRYFRLSELERARISRPESSIAEDLCSVSVPATLTWLADRASAQPNVHDIAVALLQLLIAQGEPIPVELREFASRLVGDDSQRPADPGAERENSFRDPVICLLVRRAQAESSLKFTSYQWLGPCACSIVAEQLTMAGIVMSPGAVGQVWKRRLKP